MLEKEMECWLRIS